MTTDNQSKSLLDNYFNLADNIAGLIGPHCEIALHTLQDYEHSLIKIINGHNTGRQVGFPITDIGLQKLHLFEKNRQTITPSYFTYNHCHQLLKSKTTIITDSNHQARALFCININLSQPFEAVIRSFLPPQDSSLLINFENFSNNSNEIITQVLEQTLEQVARSTQLNYKNRNKALVASLLEKGLFELKDTVQIVANHLQLSKYAIYKYLRELKTASIKPEEIKE